MGAARGPEPPVGGGTGCGCTHVPRCSRSCGAGNVTAAMGCGAGGCPTWWEMQRRGARTRLAGPLQTLDVGPEVGAGAGAAVGAGREDPAPLPTRLPWARGGCQSAQGHGTHRAPSTVHRDAGVPGGSYLGRRRCCSSRSGSGHRGTAGCPPAAGAGAAAGGSPRCRGSGRAPKAPRGSRGRGLRDMGVTCPAGHPRPRVHGTLQPPGTLADVGLRAEPVLPQLGRAGGLVAGPGQPGLGVQAGSVAMLHRGQGWDPCRCPPRQRSLCWCPLRRRGQQLGEGGGAERGQGQAGATG